MTEFLDAKKYGKVAVVYGGDSTERQISLRSGEAVLNALRSTGVIAEAVDFHGDVQSIEKLLEFDRVFIALHGRGGEDGSLQGALETLGIPYTGSQVLASALAMDKVRCKYFWQGVGLLTPGFIVIQSRDELYKMKDVESFPVIVKPAREGSSVGMSKVESSADLINAVESALQYDAALVESFIQGEEYTVAILGNNALSPVRLETPRNFYDYEAKYLANDTQYHCPCGLNKQDEEELKNLAVKAYESVGASGWGRVDVIRDQDGAFYLLEINTVPGMTDHSLVPMAAKQDGIEFSELVLEILRSSTREKGLVGF